MVVWGSEDNSFNCLKKPEKVSQGIATFVWNLSCDSCKVALVMEKLAF